MDLKIFEFTPFQQKAPVDKCVFIPRDDLTDISNGLLNNGDSLNVLCMGHQNKGVYQKTLPVKPSFYLGVKKEATIKLLMLLVNN
tara:strand:+ start:159 stop:413 length:255 start_codon:yes stop_codon:yes gene_type:complete